MRSEWLSPVLSRARLGKARLMARVWRRANIGAGSIVQPSTQGIGWRYIKIGENVIVSDDCWLNVNFKPSTKFALEIGDNSFVGRRNIISSGTWLRLGEYCLTAPDCRFIGADHISSDPLVPYGASGATSTTINVGANCWFGAGAVVAGQVRIGHGSVIGALAFVKGDVPPFSLVVGNPGRVVKRFDFQTRTWIRADAAASEADLGQPGEAEYLALLRDRFPRLRLPRLAAGRSQGQTA